MTNKSQTYWKKTACCLCSLNCGIEVEVGGADNREIVRVRGDRDHPASKGYVCEKTKRLNFYQNGADRISSPMRRTIDGHYEEIDWDTAIREIAEKFNQVRAKHGGDKILYYGGGGQGNHLGGTYGDATLKALGVKYRSNALAQEKTGEFWVNGKMLGCGVHGDFENAEVSVFIGKNPWQSHGFARARVVIRDIAKDPKRSLIVIDPRRTETADKADFHLAIKPGTDAWCLAALVAVIVQEDLVKHEWVAEHTQGYDQIEPLLSKINIVDYAERCGIEEQTLRTVARRIAAASSVSVFEDLGMQMNLHSTLGSYLQRLIWLLTGNFAKKGSSNAYVPFLSLGAASKGDVGLKPKKNDSGSSKKIEHKGKFSPVTQSKIIIGLIPCNVIPEEILTDHPNRFRAMLIESGNPAHSLADSKKMREALKALELVVVLDVAMTETARLADYVLPVSSQYEKCENSYFNLEFPKNIFHLRQPIFEPLAGTLPEAEIHSRLVLALGELKEKDLSMVVRAARFGRLSMALALGLKIVGNKSLFDFLPIFLYRALGPLLPKGSDSAAVLWGLSHLFVQNNSRSAAKAGFSGFKYTAGEKLFNAITRQHSGVIFSDADSYDESWQHVRVGGGRVNLAISELFAELESLSFDTMPEYAEFPLVLSAGERRSYTTNTIVRNPSANKGDLAGALRISPGDAAEYHLRTGGRARLTTRAGEAEVVIDVSDTMQKGHVSLPNGVGLDYYSVDGKVHRTGVSPNELTLSEDRDEIAGTPWHKHVPASLVALNQGE